MHGKLLASIIAELGTGPILADDALDNEMLAQFPRALRPAIKSLGEGIQNILQEITHSDANSLREQFNNSLMPFTLTMVSLGVYVAGIHGGDLKKLANHMRHSNIKTKTAIKELDITEDEREEISQIHQRLCDYQSVIFGIMMNRPAELEHALNAIKLDDFIKSLYGTMLSLFCMTAMDGSTRKDVGIRRALLIEMGREHSEGLEAWTETIDIYSDPEARESLARSDKWYREHDSDYAKAFPADVP